MWIQISQLALSPGTRSRIYKSWHCQFGFLDSILREIGSFHHILHLHLIVLKSLELTFVAYLATLGLRWAQNVSLAWISFDTKSWAWAVATKYEPLACIHNVFHYFVDFVSFLVVLFVDLILYDLKPLKLFVGTAWVLLEGRWLINLAWSRRLVLVVIHRLFRSFI